MADLFEIAQADWLACSNQTLYISQAFKHSSIMTNPVQQLFGQAGEDEDPTAMAIDLVSSEEEDWRHREENGGLTAEQRTRQAYRLHARSQQPRAMDAMVVDLTLSDEEELQRRDDREATILGDHCNAPVPTVFDHINPDPETDAIYRSLPAIRHSGNCIKVGKTVELRDGDFLRITLIVQHRNTEELIVRGHRFRRNTRLGGIFEKKLNEVTLLLRYATSDLLPIHVDRADFRLDMIPRNQDL